MLKNGYLQITSSFVKKMSFYLQFVTDFDPWFSNRGTNFQIGKHALSKKKGFAIFFYLLAKRCTFNLQNFDFPNPVSDGIGTKSERQGSHVTRKISEVHVYFMKREVFVSLSVSRSSFLEAVGKNISSVHHFVEYYYFTYIVHEIVPLWKDDNMHFVFRSWHGTSIIVRYHLN